MCAIWFDDVTNGLEAYVTKKIVLRVDIVQRSKHPVPQSSLIGK
jgi:hypothetical protein